MALEQLPLEGRLPGFLFLFLHGDPPIVIVTWFVRDPLWRDLPPAFSHSA